MLVAESRPRNLKWYHAGSLLFGDWGTSRLYVLGLSFFFAAHASVVFLSAVGVLMIAVAWAYVVVCRCFPEGGGVYTAARQISPTASVIGATLLLCGYIITVDISVVEALHYFGVRHDLVLPLSVAIILAIALVNWFGARSAGRAALFVAVGAGIASALIALAVLPFVPRGWSTVSLDHLPPAADAWVTFTRLCLAMAGVEAVANMTGLMKPPVARTARRTIWPVAAEVVFFNLLFGLALAGLPSLAPTVIPDAATYAGAATPPADVIAYRDTAMKVLAIEGSQHWLGEVGGLAVGKVAAIIFGLLLLSAANTAVMAMVSVLFAMGQDRELPRALTRLNYSGVPWVGLIASCAVALAVLAIEQDVAVLARLYVIGVCGAVTTNILSCALNRALALRRLERAGLWAVGGFLLAVTATIVVSDGSATLFAGSVVGSVLLIRAALRAYRVPPPLPTPEMGWLEELRQAPAVLDPARPRIMLAARGRSQSEFAVDLAHRRGAALFAIYVRTLRLMDVVPGKVPRVEDDPDAQLVLGTTAILARQAGVPFVPIYVTSTDITDEILDYTVTYNCDTLIMGKSARSFFSRTLGGDVVTRVTQHLPDNVSLILRSPNAPFTPGELPEVVRRQQEQPVETPPPPT